MLTGMTAGLGIAAVPSDQARQANAQNATETNTQSKQQADQARQEGQANQSAAGQTTGSGSSVGPGAGGDTANTPLGYAKGTHESSQVGKQR
jgi:hypothetical protein